MAVGFAATTPFTDVPSDAPYASAVARLVALDITKGVGDGKFGVDQPVTRAQMVTFVNRMLGYEGLAEMAKAEKSVFKDVPQNHWAVGHINLAYKMGLAKGVGDGKFDPNGQLTYAQALAFVLRALNYKNLEWPYGYIAQAQKLGLTAGINVGYNDIIKRGDLAIVLDRALDQKVVTYDVNGNVVTAGQPTLLEAGLTYLGYAQVTGVVTNVTATDATITPTTGNAVTVNVGSVDFKSLVGQKVTVYYKNGTAILAVPGANKIFSVVASADSTSTAVYYKDANGVQQTITVPATAPTQYNGTFTTFDKAWTKIKAGSNITVIDNTGDGNYDYVIANYYGTPFIVAKDVVANASTIYFTNAPALTLNTSSLPAVVLNGKAAALTDIKAGDVLYQVKDVNDNLVQLYIVRNKVTGTFTEIKADGSYVIAGVAYKVTMGDPNLLGKTVTATLDKDNNIVNIVAASAQTAVANYGYVIDKYSNSFTGVYQVKLLTADGSQKVFNVAEANFPTYESYVGKYVTYTVDNNNVATLTMITPIKIDSYDSTNKTFTVGSTTYYLSNDTVIFNVDETNKTYTTLKIADFAPAQGATIQIVPKANDPFNGVAMVTVDKNEVTISGPTVFVTSVSQIPNGTRFYVTKLDGTTATYDSTLPYDTYKNTKGIYDLVLNSDGTVKEVKTTALTPKGDVTNGTKVIAVDSTRIKIEGDGAVYTFADKVAVFDANGNVKTISDIVVDSYNNGTNSSKVTLYLDSNGKVAVVVIH
ncbi:S-layer homology domain-containing protein [Caldanaerobacter subterraneus]|uniref:S-layer homology domain-containing protein n=1 Tax=Caldanaerobacter subterraneus TaxID=911092 RepID=UPI0034644C73